MDWLIDRDLDLDPMTLIYELNLDILKYEWTVYVKAFKTDRHTDATENITTPHSRVLVKEGRNERARPQ